MGDIMLVWLLVSFLTMLLVVAVFTLLRLTKRLLDFDDLFEMLLFDVEVNTRYFEKLFKMDVFVNSPEIVEAQKNMIIIKQRLDEFQLRIEETINKKKLPKQKVSNNPPVAI